MAASASDVRAGGAYYEMYAKDSLTPVLVKARATVAAFGTFLQHFSPGAGGTGFINRLVFGDKLFDAKTNEYLGRVGGLVAPLRTALAPVASALAGPLAVAGRVLATIGGAARATGDALVRAFGRGERAVWGLVSGLLKVGGTLTLVSGALGAPLVGLFKGGVDRAADLARLAKQTGLTIDALNRMKYAADVAGVSLDEVMSDTTGRYSADMAAAPPIDAADARAAADAQRQLADATRALQDAMLPLVSSVAPYVKLLAAWVKENAHLIAPLGAAALGLSAVGVAAGVAVFAVGGLVSLFGVLKGIVAGIAAFVVSPWGLATAAVAGLSYAFLTLTESGRGVLAWARGGLADAFGTARAAWGGLANALKKGDLEGALEIATTSLELVWAGTIARMEKAWNGFKAYFVDGWHDLTAGLAQPLRAMWGDFVDVVRSAATKIGAALSDLWEQIRGPVMRVLEFLKPIGIALAAPFVFAAALIQRVWDELDRNLVVNVVNFGSWVEKIFARVGAAVENTFKAVLNEILRRAHAAASVLNGLSGGQLNGTLAEIERAKAAIGDPRDADKEVAAIEARRKAVLDKLQSDREAAEKARAEGRAADAAQADARVADAQKRLDALVERANVPRVPGDDKLGLLKPNLVPDVSVKGTFGGGSLAQQLGFADKAVQQTEVLKQINETLKNNPAETARQLAPLVKPQTVR